MYSALRFKEVDSASDGAGNVLTDGMAAEIDKQTRAAVRKIVGDFIFVLGCLER